MKYGKMKVLTSVIFVLIFTVVMQCAVFAEAENPDRLIPRLTDEADLLSTGEEAALLQKLDEISERQQLDIVIMTVESLGGTPITDFADDAFDNNGFGMGTGRDGILFLISMEYRDWAISTRGYGMTVFTDAGQEYIMDKVFPYLSSGDYEGAFNEFADLCDSFLLQAAQDGAYDIGKLPSDHDSLTEYPDGFTTEPDTAYEEKPDVAFLIGLSVILGGAFGFIPVGCMRSKMKTEKPQQAASDYVRKNSFKLTESRDVFLYRNISKTSRASSSSGSGGSSSHHSSSGASHGGSHGKF